MALSASTLAGYYDRLHQKFQAPDALIDPSWGCADGTPRDRLRWICDQFDLSDRTPRHNLSFDDFVERLILLSPVELKKFLCGLGALGMPGDLRHCIDGRRLRNLRSTVGPSAFDMLMQRPGRDNVDAAELEWSVDSLCKTGLMQIEAFAKNAENKFALPISLLKVSLPKSFAHDACCALTSEAQPLPMGQLKALYPEFRWLFG